MKSRLYPQRVRASAAAVLAAIATAAAFAAAPSPAQAQFGGGGTISGNVTKPGGIPLEGATVTALRADGSGAASAATTTANGNYSIRSPLIPAGNYKIRFDAPGFVREYYNDAADFAAAQSVTVEAFTDTPNVNATLTPQATISGTVTDSAANPVAGVCVQASPQSGGVSPPVVRTGANGEYTMADVEAGTYAIQFDPCDSPANVLGEWYDNAADEMLAQGVTVAAGDNLAGIDAQLATGGSISGTVMNAQGQPADGAQIKIRTALGVIESGTAAADGTYTVGQLPTGSYKVEFNAPPGSYDLTEFYANVTNEASATPVIVNAGGNTPGIDADLEGDTIPPVVTINSGPSGPTQEPQPTFTFSTEPDASLQCSVDTGTPSYGPCTDPPGSHTQLTALADGSYTFRVKATDPSGNPAEATRTFTVDRVAPTLSITGGPSGATGFTAPTFTFSAEAGANVQCVIDDGADPTPDWSACTSSSSHTPATLTDGDYVFHVRATDAALNRTTAQRAFTVDSDGPNLGITGGPAAATNDSTPTYTFNVSQNAALECAIDPSSASAPSYGACSDALAHTPSALADGAYVFSVRATDDVGNQTTAQRSFTVDTVAPSVAITGGPSGPTSDPTPSFEFSASGGDSVECAVDAPGAATPSWGACTAVGGHDAASLADGSHVFRVRSTDAAGNRSSDQRSFSVDTAISLSITSGPGGPTNDSTPTFAFDAEAGAAVECSIDTGTPSYGSCSAAASHTPAALADGGYTFRVRATDAAINSIVATRDFSVDTVAPALSITGGPAGETTDPRPTFSFNAESGATVQCSIDTGSPSFGGCASGSSHAPAGPLPDGSYIFRVRATDAAGNSATAVRSFDLDAPNAPPPDTTPPSVEITGGPAGKTKDKTPTFEFESNDASATFSCKVDNGAAFDCESPTTLSKLKPGRHTFSVIAMDRAGNDSQPVSQTFTLKKKKKRK